MMNSTFNIQHSKLRIGFDAKRAFNNHTGLGNYSRFVIKGMLELFPQHEYYLFTPKIRMEFSEFFRGYSNVHIITPRHFLGKTFRSLWRTYGISAWCNKLKLDVFHGLSNELPAGIERFEGRRIVTIHDLIFLRYPGYYKAVDRKIYARKFKNACIHADCIIAASRQTASDIVSFFGISSQKIQVVYQGCDEQFEKRLTETQKQDVRLKYHLPGRFIVCIGTIEERKDQFTVLKAFHKANPQANLVFVGRQTEYAQQLHAYCKENRLEDQVTFIEGAAFEDFPAFYQAAEMAIYASKFEGFGIPVLEALKCGTKMLVADTSSLTEVGGDAVDYFDTGNSEQLAKLISKTLLSPFKQKEAGIQLAKFDTPRLMRKLHELYLVTK